MSLPPLQAPYCVTAAAAASMTEPIEAATFTARPETIRARGVAIENDPADAFAFHCRLNGRPVTLLSGGGAAGQARRFGVWVDALACAENREAPALVARRALEALGLDDLTQ